MFDMTDIASNFDASFSNIGDAFAAVSGVTATAWAIGATTNLAHADRKKDDPEAAIAKPVAKYALGGLMMGIA